MTGLMAAAWIAAALLPGPARAEERGMGSSLAELHTIAKHVIDGARVTPGGEIPGGRVNTTGHSLRLPGATLDYYPAFWVRDAAMTLGSDFVGAAEVEGWIRLIASVQPGPAGLQLPRGLIIPPYSIPDHITLGGKACWFPGAFEEQGDGTFGFLPPADDAYFFVQMVREQCRLAASRAILSRRVQTPWGEPTVADVAERAFGSVAVDPATGLVACDATPGRTRVDWGFCDTVRKTGLCLMPSLLRWRAARDLADLFGADRDQDRAARFAAEADRVRRSLAATFFRPLEAAPDGSQGCLLSATGKGAVEDIWGESYAVWLRVLPARVEAAVTRRLRALYRAGGVVAEGQVRAMPPGVFWDDCLAGHGTYQNGGFWGTPTGWFIAALRRLEPAAAPASGRDSERMLADFLAHLRDREPAGAPFEWVNPATGAAVNPRYCSTVGLVHTALIRDAAYGSSRR